MTKHVYILGAGFSRPLGGPLFTDLLTLEYWNSFSEVEIPDEMRECLSYLQLDDSSKKKRQIDEMLGRAKPLNAEELIGILEWCTRSQSKRAKLIYDSFTVMSAKLKYPDQCEFFTELNKQVKRLVACQCNSFTKDLEAESDITAPYVAWLKSLSHDDTIITFNYDTAIETIGATCGVDFPREPTKGRYDQPRLIHIHGCVEWRLHEKHTWYEEDAYLKEGDLCLAMPGLAKAKITDYKDMETLWSSAMSALREAEIVSIVGYSMPATDNKARQEILGAMRNGQRVNLVVGNDSFTAGRMQSLMQPIVGTQQGTGISRVVDMKMFAQDYLPNVKLYGQFDYTTRTQR